MMLLTEEIRQAAETLGKHLGADHNVQEFVSLKAKTQQEAEVVVFENKLVQLAQTLAERQKSGEVLNQSELSEYRHLRRQVQGNPLIAARDNQLEIVKAIFVQTAQGMTSVLGIEYPTFAQEEEEK